MTLGKLYKLDPDDIWDDYEYAVCYHMFESTLFNSYFIRLDLERVLNSKMGVMLVSETNLIEEWVTEA